jgi:hypothetical protein
MFRHASKTPKPPEEEWTREVAGEGNVNLDGFLGAHPNCLSPPYTSLWGELATTS